MIKTLFFCSHSQAKSIILTTKVLDSDKDLTNSYFISLLFQFYFLIINAYKNKYIAQIQFIQYF